MLHYMAIVEYNYRRKIQTWYYTTNLHTGAFMLPRYVEDLLEEAEDRVKKKED